jgi:hypothetical protein
VLLGVNAVVVGLWFALALGGYGTGEEGLRHINRYLARWSFTLFSAAFVASSWHALFPSGASRWVMAHRRGIGLCFAMTMLAHLGTIFWLLRRFPEVRIDAATAIAGGIGYGFILVMSVTSNDRAVRLLGRRKWKWLHTVGVNYIWAVFTFTFVAKIGQNVGLAPLAAWCFTLMGFRLWGKARGRRSEQVADA